MLRVTSAVLVLAALLAPTAAHAEVPFGPDDNTFYQGPSGWKPEHHGAAIWQRPYAGTMSIEGATNTAFLYQQRGVERRSVVTSGFVAVPSGEAPAGGWPVVAWGHGTTGLANRCAPTRSDNAEDAEKHGALLSSWVAAGYAVVRTDYEGLGTPGMHPYLGGVSAGRSMLDAVRAAREIYPDLGTDLVLAGHSQGAHAALWAAALAPSYAPELTERGTVAMAPPSQLTSIVDLLRGNAISGGPSASLAYFLYGAQAVDSTLHVKRTVLSDAARALWPQLTERCKPELATADSFGSLPSNDVIDPGAPMGRVRKVLRTSDPRTLDLPAPLLLQQGTSDFTVLKTWTDDLAEQLAARGDDVDYRTYEGATHATLPDAAAADATAFLAQAFGV